MRWSVFVKQTLDTLVDSAAKADNELEKAIYNEINERVRNHFDTISLAVIASSLSKIAGYEDEICENYFEDLNIKDKRLDELNDIIKEFLKNE